MIMFIPSVIITNSSNENIKKDKEYQRILYKEVHNDR